MKPAFQRQEDPRIGQLDDMAQTILLKMRVMSRAAPKDRPHIKAEIRELLQKYADKVMGLANAFLG